MNEQFAFAIAFDQQTSEQNGHTEQYLANWPQLMEQISNSVVSHGFPGLEHPRWEEFGEGRIFWGTKQECEAIKGLISALPVLLYEERNLDPGYYKAPAGIYFVQDSGDIMALTTSSESDEVGAVQLLQSIPIDAYKSQAIAPEIQAKFQQAMFPSYANQSQNQPTFSPEPQLAQVQTLERQLTTQNQKVTALEQQIEQLSMDLRAAQVESASKVEPEALAALRMQLDQQVVQTQEREQSVQQSQSQIHDLQLMLELKVDPDVHAHLQQQAQAQAEQITELEQEINQLREQVLSAESQPMPVDEYDRLKQLSSEQSRTIATLEERIQQLRSQLDHSKAQAEREAEAAQNSNAAIVQGLEQQVTKLNQDCQALRAKVAEKVDPRDYEVARAEANELTLKLHQMEQSQKKLSNDVSAWTQIAHSKVEMETHQELEKVSQGQAQQLITLQQEVRSQQQEASEWKQLANSKIDPIDYEAALDQIRTMKAKLSRTWLQRLKDWFQGT